MGSTEGNLANFELTAADVQALDDAIKVIEDVFQKIGASVLTAEEYSDYDVVDRERYGFLTTVLEDVKVEPRAVAPKVNTGDLAADEAVQAILMPRETKLVNLANLGRSARVLVVWDMWVAVGRIYRWVRFNAKEGNDWAITLYDKWKVQYERLSREGGGSRVPTN